MKRGADRTRLQRDCDVLVCGASFAGLAVARELAGSGARVLVIDRYEIGERQTSACGIPTLWLEALGLQGAQRQTFDRLVVHTPWRTSSWRLPWTFSTFDYRELCALLWEQAGADGIDTRFETATVVRREGSEVHTDRGELRAPLIVDALGWRRVLSTAVPIQPPHATLSRGLEVHPPGAGDEMQLWIDPRYIRAGYSWASPRATSCGWASAPTGRPIASGSPRCAWRATWRCRRRATRATGSPTICGPPSRTGSSSWGTPRGTVSH